MFRLERATSIMFLAILLVHGVIVVASETGKSVPKSGTPSEGTNAVNVASFRPARKATAAESVLNSPSTRATARSGQGRIEGTLPGESTATGETLQPPDHSVPQGSLVRANESNGISSATSNTLNWFVIDNGGEIGLTSGGYTMSASVGQSIVGLTSSPGFSMSSGFWAGTTSGCNCPHQGDINTDAVIDVFDVIDEIGIAFSGAADPQDPSCPRPRSDVNNDGVSDVFDVIYLIATAFSGGANPISPCGP
jgi:hypothetical protein